MAPTTLRNRSSTAPATTQPAAPRRGQQPKPSAKAVGNQKNIRLYTTVLGTTEDDSADQSSGSASAEVSAKLDVLTRLVVTLSETITRQNIVVEGARAELKKIKAEQRDLKTQNTQWQEEVRTLQAKLDRFSAALPSTISWASIAAGQRTTEGGSSLSWTNSTRNAKKERTAFESAQTLRKRTENRQATALRDTCQRRRPTPRFETP